GRAGAGYCGSCTGRGHDRARTSSRTEGLGQGHWKAGTHRKVTADHSGGSRYEAAPTVYARDHRRELAGIATRLVFIGGALNDQDFITIARIVKAQGRRGEVIAEILKDFPERFAAREQLLLVSEAKAVRREVVLENSWLHKGRVVLKFRGVDSIEAAQSLAGCELRIPKRERAEPDVGSSSGGDLVGCSLWDRS